MAAVKASATSCIISAGVAGVPYTELMKQIRQDNCGKDLQDLGATVEGVVIPAIVSALVELRENNDVFTLTQGEILSPFVTVRLIVNIRFSFHFSAFCFRLARDLHFSPPSRNEINVLLRL